MEMMCNKFVFFCDCDIFGNFIDKKVNKCENWIFVGKGKWVLVNLFYKLGQLIKWD